MPQLAPERTFELQSVHVQIKTIDPIQQTFRALYYIEMRARGGQLDKDFWGLDDAKKPVNKMTPGKEEGRKVVPSVMWYLENQIHFENALSHEILECKAIPAKSNEEDLTCIVRIQGDFQEEMELFDFPLDCQNLTLVFSIQCALNTSPFPVQLNKPKKVALAVDDETFVLRNTWDLNPEPFARAHTHKGIKHAGGIANEYPAISVSVRVDRLATYYIYNVVLPMGLFSFLAILAPFSIMHYDTSDRLGVSLGLVLTAAAYKLAISQMVPTVSYLTLLDYYVLEQGAIIALVTIQNSIVGVVSGPIAFIWSSFTISPEVDFATLCGILVIWIISQVKTCCIWRKKHRNRQTIDDDLRLLKKMPSTQGSIVSRLMQRPAGDDSDSEVPKKVPTSKGCLPAMPLGATDADDAASSKAGILSQRSPVGSLSQRATTSEGTPLKGCGNE